MGRVEGWQQDLVEADHTRRRVGQKTRQAFKNSLRERQDEWAKGHQDRFDARQVVTQKLKSQQRFRYFRTVFDPKYE